MRPPGDDQAEEEDDDDDDDNIEEVPSVPETDQKQAARDDAIEDEAIEESKSPLTGALEESKLIEELSLPPPEPFRLDELRISAPMLRNELSDSLNFFEK